MLSLLALASSACWGTSDFFAGLFSRRRPAVAVVGWTQALAFVVLCVVVLTQHDHVTWAGWPMWSVGAGLSGLTGLLCFYTALSTGTMGVVAPIAALGVAVPVLLGVATGDEPSAWTWVGILVAVVGVTLASGPELGGDVSTRPVILAGVVMASGSFSRVKTEISPRPSSIGASCATIAWFRFGTSAQS